MLAHPTAQQTFPRSLPLISRQIGVASLYAFGFSALFIPALANTALGLMLLAALLEPARLARAARSSGSLALLLALLAVFGLGLAFGWPPAHRPLDLSVGTRFIQLWVFWLIAYWTDADDKRISRLLAFALAGFMLGRIVAIDWSTPPAILTGERIRLGFSSINHFGEYSGALLIGLVCFRARLWKTAEPWRWWVRAGWAAGTLTAIYWTIAAQSRGVWVALLALLVLRIVTLTRRPRIKLLVLGALIALGIAGLATDNVVSNRILSEASTYRQILGGEWASLPYDSIGIRVHMLHFGLQQWAAHPWFGNGPGATPQLLAGAAEVQLHDFKHLHNLPLEFLVRLGALGASIMAALFATILFASWRAWRRGLLPGDIAAFALTVLMLDAIFNLTDFRLLAWDGRNFWLLFAGLGYATALRART
ncbi:O-antigen ligase family protein [Azoarcus sp. DN11]|uniref:O-antigen ligase family protein n=1 Tax=Azoarcus sp. DN11 TaxID=356837 RepID=UPI000EB260DB|nr:O-antigen ligase family protein [Azoarcus sp. DN11]AYH42276.1 hypothetical protein CDA09_02545 [Azoarcus sp. DN11]